MFNWQNVGKMDWSMLKLIPPNPCLFVQYIPRNMHTVFALLCFVVAIHWLIFPYPSGLLHWHCGNLTIAPVPAKQPWWIWINTWCEFIMNDSITTTKPCAYFLGYTVVPCSHYPSEITNQLNCLTNYFITNHICLLTAGCRKYVIILASFVFL